MKDDRPPRDDQDTMPESSRFRPCRTRRLMTPSVTHGIVQGYNYSTAVIPGGDDGARPMADYMHDTQQDDKNEIEISIQAPLVKTNKPPLACVRRALRRELGAPRSGTSAPTDGNASGHQFDLCTLRPPTVSEVFAVWPPLSALGATNFDQHDATSTPAATSPRDDGSAANYADM
jgi:hypothetical protein